MSVLIKEYNFLSLSVCLLLLKWIHFVALEETKNSLHEAHYIQSIALHANETKWRGCSRGAETRIFPFLCLSAILCDFQRIHNKVQGLIEWTTTSRFQWTKRSAISLLFKRRIPKKKGSERRRKRSFSFAELSDIIPKSRQAPVLNLSYGLVTIFTPLLFQKVKLRLPIICHVHLSFAPCPSVPRYDTYVPKNSIPRLYRMLVGGKESWTNVDRWMLVAHVKHTRSSSSSKCRATAGYWRDQGTDGGG